MPASVGGARSQARIQDFLPLDGFRWLHTYPAGVFPERGASRSCAWAGSPVVGLGRMVLAYPELPLDILQGRPVNKKRNCRTFSDCTTAPRNGIVSGCYPLDAHYKKSPEFKQLAVLKKSPGRMNRSPCYSPSPRCVAGHRHHGNAYGAAAGPGRLRHGLEPKLRTRPVSSRSSVSRSPKLLVVGRYACRMSSSSC